MPVFLLDSALFSADHVFGARVLAGNDNPDVYAHETLPTHLDKTMNVVGVNCTLSACVQQALLLAVDCDVSARNAAIWHVPHFRHGVLAGLLACSPSRIA